VAPEVVGGVRQLRGADDMRVVATFGAGAISNLTMIRAGVFFSPNDGTHRQELWTSDGTVATISSRSDTAAGASRSTVSATRSLCRRSFVAVRFSSFRSSRLATFVRSISEGVWPIEVRAS
jgi:ELWxxDGT repeat protein